MSRPTFKYELYLGSTWRDFSAFVLTAKMFHGRQRPTDEVGPGTATLTVADDGRFDPGATSGPAEWVSGGVSLIRARANLLRVTTTAPVAKPVWYGRMSGYPARTSQAGGAKMITTLTFTDVMADLAKAQAAPLTTAVGVGELAGARATRILSNAGWAGATSIDPGSTGCLATALTQPALTELRTLAASEGGDVWADRDGTIVFTDRTYRVTNSRATSSRFTCGPNTGAGEIPFPLTPDVYESDTQANRIIYGTTGGLIVTAEDTGLQATDGIIAKNPRTDLVCDTAIMLRDVAAYDLARLKNPEHRIPKVVLHGDRIASFPWSTILDTKRHDRITVKQLTMNGSSFNSGAFVEGIGWDIAADHVNYEIYTGSSAAWDAFGTGWWTWDTSTWDGGDKWFY